MFASSAMNQNFAAAACSAAGFDARRASMLCVIMDAVITASIFVVLADVLALSVLVNILVLAVLVSVLVRIIIGLVAPPRIHTAVPQT